MARSVVVCIAALNKIPSEWECIRRPDCRNTHQREKALEYCRGSGVNPNYKCGESEAKKFEQYLNVRIKIIAGDLLNKCIYGGRTDNLNLPSLYIFRSKSLDGSYHYDAIINIEQFYEKPYFCHVCNKAYKFMSQHRCPDVLSQWCFSCNIRECSLDDGCLFEQCKRCDKVLRSPQCKIAHEKFEENNCLTYTCVFCQSVLKRNQLPGGNFETNSQILSRHGKCKITCTICQASDISPTHKCYMQYVPFKSHINNVVYLDFETSQDDGVHRAVYCYIKWIFKDNYQHLQEEGSQEFGVAEDVCQQVGEFLFAKKFKNSTIVAHNMKGFDGCFLIKYLTDNNLKPDRVIVNGTKLVSFHVPRLNIRIVDSLSFLPMALSQIPKAFGLDESQYIKGYFPHFFTKPCNFHSIHLLPDKKDFGYDTFSSEQITRFDAWYEERKGTLFDFDAEMKKYCKQDVDILCEGFEAFRKTVMCLSQEMLANSTLDENLTLDDHPLPSNSSSFSCAREIEKHVAQPSERGNNPCDPLAYITLAGLCHAIYKACFLKPNSIALVPASGYSSHKYSNKAVEWLEYLRQTSAPGIKHAGNSSTGECKVGKFRVDGFDDVTKTVYEFYGCFFHGHSQCVDDMSNINPVTQISFQGLFNDTMLRERQISALGYTVIHIWECEWVKQKTNNMSNSILEQCLIDVKGFLPINPRHAFKGGRTEAFRLQADVTQDKNKQIQYADVNSLYPFVLAKKDFPVGHPLILSHISGVDISHFFGFIKCSVLPPRKLYHPVLPLTAQKKLLFPLCGACADGGLVNECEHSDAERCIQETWFSEELKLAEQMGYVVQKIFQVMHFEKSTKGLFHGYVQTFYKMKILASGKPQNVETFLQELNERENIVLDIESFDSNPARRWLAKLLLNAFWGRFGMREDRTGCEFVSSVSELNVILNDLSREITMIKPIGESMVVLSYKYKHTDLIPMMNNTNLYIAAITTAYARMELYKYLDMCSFAEKSTSRALYCDTDSIIYEFDNSDSSFSGLPIGPHLGELTNELGSDDFITHFVSGGPKNYAYRTHCSKECVKVKGFSLHAMNKEVFTIENLESMLSYFIHKHLTEDKSRVLTSNLKIHKQGVQASRDHFLPQHFPSDDMQDTNSTSLVLFEKEKGISVICQHKIRRTGDFQLKSVVEQRLHSVYYDKRVIYQNYDTCPFGF
jgi:hypothetical protein